MSVTLFALGVCSNPGIMTSEGEDEVPSTRNSSMAGSVSSDSIGLTDPSYEEKDTPERSDTNSLGAHESTESACDIQVTVAGHSSPTFSVNMDNNADTRNSPAGELKCPHFSTVSKSQSEIDIHIREKHVRNVHIAVKCLQ